MTKKWRKSQSMIWKQLYRPKSCDDGPTKCLWQESSKCVDCFLRDPTWYLPLCMWKIPASWTSAANNKRDVLVLMTFGSSPPISIKNCWAQEKPPAIKPLPPQLPFKRGALCVRPRRSDGGKNQPCWLNLCTQVTLMLASPVRYGRNENPHENWIENVSV